MGNYYRRHTSVHDAALAVFVRGRGRVHQSGIWYVVLNNATAREKDFKLTWDYSARLGRVLTGYRFHVQVSLLLHEKVFLAPWWW